MTDIDCYDCPDDDACPHDHNRDDCAAEREANRADDALDAKRDALPDDIKEGL